mgnify:FL=1|tara:strand:+ start:25613 stop:25861 length:249 start_codon:yes stop_codon:yes gene_type:complete
MGFFEWIISFFKSEEPKAVEPVKAKAKAPAAQPAPAEKVTKASLSKLTKAQIEEKGREFGVEVDRRKKKDDLVAEVLKASKK